METFRGHCLSRRREAKVLRKDLIHKCLEDKKDAQTISAWLFTLRTNQRLPSYLIHSTSESAFKTHWFLLPTNETAVQTSFVSFVVILSSYLIGSDTHKALVDRAKSPDAFWHHRTRVLHHLWNKNNEPLRFCFIVKRKTVQKRRFT